MTKCVRASMGSKHVKKISRSYILKSAVVKTGFLCLLLLLWKKLHWILDFLYFGFLQLVRKSFFVLFCEHVCPFFILPWLSKLYSMAWLDQLNWQAEFGWCAVLPLTHGAWFYFITSSWGKSWPGSDLTKSLVTHGAWFFGCRLAYSCPQGNLKWSGERCAVYTKNISNLGVNLKWSGERCAVCRYNISNLGVN